MDLGRSQDVWTRRVNELKCEMWTHLATTLKMVDRCISTFPFVSLHLSHLSLPLLLLPSFSSLFLPLRSSLPFRKVTSWDITLNTKTNIAYGILYDNLSSSVFGIPAAKEREKGKRRRRGRKRGERERGRWRWVVESVRELFDIKYTWDKKLMPTMERTDTTRQIMEVHAFCVHLSIELFIDDI